MPLVDEARHRASAQAHQQHVARVRTKEQKASSRAVVELDPVGRIQPHRALDRVPADLQPRTPSSSTISIALCGPRHLPNAS